MGGSLERGSLPFQSIGYNCFINITIESYVEEREEKYDKHK